MEGFITAGLSLGNVLGRKEKKAQLAGSSHAAAIRSDSYKCAEPRADVRAEGVGAVRSARLRSAAAERDCGGE